MSTKLDVYFDDVINSSLKLKVMLKKNKAYTTDLKMYIEFLKSLKKDYNNKNAIVKQEKIKVHFN